MLESLYSVKEGKRKSHQTHLGHLTKGLDEQIRGLHLDLVNGYRTIC